MDKLALDINCWHYLNRDRFQYKNMELVKEINSNNKSFSMISEVQAGQGDRLFCSRRNASLSQRTFL